MSRDLFPMEDSEKKNKHAKTRICNEKLMLR